MTVGIWDGMDVVIEVTFGKDDYVMNKKDVGGILWEMREALMDEGIPAECAVETTCYEGVYAYSTAKTSAVKEVPTHLVVTKGVLTRQVNLIDGSLTYIWKSKG